MLARVAIGGAETDWRQAGQMNVACMIVAVVGRWFSFLGLLIFLRPNATKNDVQRAMLSAVENARDDIERKARRTRDRIRAYRLCCKYITNLIIPRMARMTVKHPG